VEPVYSPSTVSCRASGTNPGKVTIDCSARIVDYVVTPTAAGATLTQTSYDTGASGSVDHDGWFGVYSESGPNYHLTIIGQIRINAAGGRELTISQLSARNGDHFASGHGGPDR
jgi:hypothetical protein